LDSSPGGSAQNGEHEPILSYRPPPSKVPSNRRKARKNGESPRCRDTSRIPRRSKGSSPSAFAVRERFREEVDVDDATWIRGRGWALSVAVIALPYYEKSHPAFARLASDMIRAVLDE